MYFYITKYRPKNLICSIQMGTTHQSLGPLVLGSISPRVLEYQGPLVLLFFLIFFPGYFNFFFQIFYSIYVLMLVGPRTGVPRTFGQVAPTELARGPQDCWTQGLLGPRTTGPKYSRTQGLLGRAQCEIPKFSSIYANRVRQVFPLGFLPCYLTPLLILLLNTWYATVT